MKNAGKIFEEDIKKSMPDYVVLIRLNDSPQVFKQSSTTRFTLKTPCDYIAFDTNSKILYFFELKSTKYKSISFEDIDKKEQQSKMIHKHQILGLKKYSEYNSVKAGFLFNFRDEKNNIERTYFQDIIDFESMCKKINKHSFNEIDLCLNNSVKINGNKKRVRYNWDIDSFFKNN